MRYAIALTSDEVMAEDEICDRQENAQYAITENSVSFSKIHLERDCEDF